MGSTSILDAFSTLRSNFENQQINAGVRIIDHLVKEQGAGVKTNRELQLAVKRIIRGLGAPKSASRFGFFTVFSALPEVFKLPTFTLDLCLQIIDKELEANSREELADVCKGQILAYGALIFSNKILEANNEQIQLILNKIISLRNVKTYLKLSAHIVLIEMFKKVSEDIFEHSMWNLVQSKIIRPDSSDKKLIFYHLLLVLNERFPDLVHSKFLMNVIGAPTVIHENTINEIGKLMMNTERLTFVDSFIYQDILRSITSDVKLMKRFWSIVNNHLSVGSESKIKLVLKLFTCIIPGLKNKNMIQHLLKEQFVSILVTEFPEQLEQHRLTAINTLIDVTKDKGKLNTSAQKSIVYKLVFYPGNFKFIFGTGRKLINSLINNFDEEAVKYFAELFCDVITGKSSKTLYQEGGKEPILRPWRAGQKKKACNILARLLNLSVVDHCIDWKVLILKIIIDFAFFTHLPTVTLERAADGCFFNAMDSKQNNLMDQTLLFKQLILYINEKLINCNWTRINRTDKFMASWKHVIDAVKMIGNASDIGGSVKLGKTVFEVIFLLLGIMLIRDVDSAAPIIKELHTTYNVMIKTFKKNGRKKTAINGGHSNYLEKLEEELHWTEVIVDLILSLLSNESHLQRNLIARVFVYLCPYLTSQNINQILKVLNPNEGGVMAENNDESDSDNSEEEDDSELNDSNEEKSKSESEMSSEEDIEEDEVAGVDEKELEVLRNNIQEALRTKDDDNGSVNLDDMSEEEGRQLDESLSEAFKKSKQFLKKSQAAEEKQLNIFRARAFDLLEVYLKAEPELVSIFDIMVTVLMLLENLINSGSNIELQNRIRSFLKKLTSVKKYTVKRKLDVAQLMKLLEKLINRDERTVAVYLNMKEQMIDCCTFILKLSLKEKQSFKKMRPQVLRIYQDALTNFFTKKNNVTPFGLFLKGFALPWEGVFSMSETVIDLLEENKVRPYHLGHVVILLQALFTNGRLLNTENLDRYKLVVARIVTKLISSADDFQNLTIKVRKQYIGLIQVIIKQGIARRITKGVNVLSLRKKLLHSSEMAKPEIAVVREKQPEEEEKENLLAVRLHGNETQEIIQSEESTQLKKLSKKRKYREALKKKKVSKIRRIQKSSEGLEEGLFSTSLTTNHAFIKGEVVKSDED